MQAVCLETATLLLACLAPFVSAWNFSTSPTTSTTPVSSTHGIGGLILQGIGVSSSSDTASSPGRTNTAASQVPPTFSMTNVTTHNVSISHSISVPHAPVSWSTFFPSSYMSHAQSCWSAYTSWYASYPAYYLTANISVVTTPITTVSTSYYRTSTTNYPTTSLDTYTLCDKTPRAHFSPPTVYFEATARETLPGFQTLSPSIPPPSCTPNVADCAIYYHGSNIQQRYENATDPTGIFAFDRLLGSCGLPTDGTYTDPCLVQGGPVRLYYFPVTVEGGGLCGPNGTTVTNTRTAEPITTLGTTFQPGSAYLSFETLYAGYSRFDDAAGPAVQIGPGFKNTILDFRSDEISTNCHTIAARSVSGFPGYGPGTQLNFADLNAPVPASAYSCQNQCQSLATFTKPDGDYTSTLISPNPCQTIFDNFNPLIAVPTRLRDLVPAWSTCSFWDWEQPDIIFDPPTALSHAASIATPTLPSVPHSSSASPGHTVTAPPMQTHTTASQDGSGHSSHGNQPPPPPAHSSSAIAESQGSTSAVGQGPPHSQPTRSSRREGSASSTAIPFTPVSEGKGSSTATGSGGSQGHIGNPLSSSGGVADPSSPAHPDNGDPQTIPYAPIGEQSTNAASSSDVEAPSAAIFQLGDHSVTAAVFDSSIVIGANTILKGQSMTLSGDVISAGETGMIVDPVSSDPGEVLAAGGSITITAFSVPGATDEVVVDGQTLSAGGPAVTVGGEVLSMASQSLVMVEETSAGVESSTSSLSGASDISMSSATHGDGSSSGATTSTAAVSRDSTASTAGVSLDSPSGRTGVSQGSMSTTAEVSLDSPSGKTGSSADSMTSRTGSPQDSPSAIVEATGSTSTTSSSGSESHARVQGIAMLLVVILAVMVGL